MTYMGEKSNGRRPILRKCDGSDILSAMEAQKSQLILCPKCGQKTPLKIQKIFDDHFNPVAEKKICSFCKLEFMADEKIPYLEAKTQTIFDPHAERRICQYCKNYVVNPWTQKCMLWNKEVTATDSCSSFVQKKESGP